MWMWAVAGWAGEPGFDVEAVDVAGGDVLVLADGADPSQRVVTQEGTYTLGELLDALDALDGTVAYALHAYVPKLADRPGQIRGSVTQRRESDPGRCATVLGATVCASATTDPAVDLAAGDTLALTDVADATTELVTDEGAVTLGELLLAVAGALPGAEALARGSDEPTGEVVGSVTAARKVDGAGCATARGATVCLERFPGDDCPEWGCTGNGPERTGLRW